MLQKVTPAELKCLVKLTLQQRSVLIKITLCKDEIEIALEE